MKHKRYLPSRPVTPDPRFRRKAREKQPTDYAHDLVSIIDNSFVLKIMPIGPNTWVQYHGKEIKYFDLLNLLGGQIKEIKEKVNRWIERHESTK